MNNKKRKDVEDIIIKYLLDNGYDGLCNNDCGCPIDSLRPCEFLSLDCTPGYKVQQTTCQDCYIDCGRDIPKKDCFIICEKKPK